MSEKTAPSESSNRKSTVEAVVDRLSVEILDGVLAPGEELREVELSKRLGVSRATLREALAHMSFRGLLDRQFQRSVRVREVTVEDAVDLHYLRSLLEGDAVRRLAVDPSKWPHVQMAVRRLEDLPSEAPWSEVVQADIAFHAALVKAIGSPRLAAAHNRLTDEMRLMFSPGRLYVNAALMAAAHRTLFEEIRSGDVANAQEAMQRHLEIGTQRIMNHLSSSPGNHLSSSPGG